MARLLRIAETTLMAVGFVAGVLVAATVDARGAWFFACILGPPATVAVVFEVLRWRRRRRGWNDLIRGLGLAATNETPAQFPGRPERRPPNDWKLQRTGTVVWIGDRDLNPSMDRVRLETVFGTLRPRGGRTWTARRRGSWARRRSMDPMDGSTTGDPRFDHEVCIEGPVSPATSKELRGEALERVRRLVRFADIDATPDGWFVRFRDPPPPLDAALDAVDLLVFLDQQDPRAPLAGAPVQQHL